MRAPGSAEKTRTGEAKPDQPDERESVGVAQYAPGEADGGSAAAAPVSEVRPSDGPDASITGAQRDHPAADSSVADAPVVDELPTGTPRYCPMCTTCYHDLSNTAGRRAIILAAALDVSTKDQFERAFDSDKPFDIPFKVCRSCNNKVDAHQESGKRYTVVFS